jgi:hypothetical protein
MDGKFLHGSQTPATHWTQVPCGQTFMIIRLAATGEPIGEENSRNFEPSKARLYR